MRRKAKKVVVDSGNGQGYAKVEDVNRATQTLAKSIDGVASAMNQNVGAIRNAFTFVDAHQMVSRRVISDMHKGAAQIKDGEVDWEWYHVYYNVVVSFSVFVHNVKALEVKTPEPKAEIESLENDYEFSTTPTTITV